MDGGWEVLATNVKTQDFLSNNIMTVEIIPSYPFYIAFGLFLVRVLLIQPGHQAL